ncbi:MAG: hypothetical protein FJ090_21435 [Deltaproteobacteria bacterium]|nr:hypothetical protein [Deltaproteobacteria bacterium]
MTLALLVGVQLASAACRMVQTPAESGTRLHIEAVSEPLSCRAVFLRADGGARIRARLDGRRVSGRDVFELDGDQVVALPAMRPGSVADIEIDVPGSALLVSLGEPTPRVPAAETHVAWTVSLDERHPAWSFADPRLGQTVETVATLRPEGRASRRWGGAPAQGSRLLAPGSFTLEIPGANLVGTASAGVNVTRTLTALRFDAPEGGTARWRVSAAGGQAVIPDVATYVAGLDWRFRVASFPEPALPADFRRDGNLDTRIEDIWALVRARMVAANYPGADPLRPRPLHRAWRSEWGSGVERALVLLRLLQQQHVVAGWLLTGHDPDPMTLTGYDHLVLALAAEGGDMLVDPACAPCALGEVSTRVAGKPAVGGAERVPVQPGTLSRRIALHGTEFRVSVEATGAAALWLREESSALGGLVRADRIAAALGVVAGRVVTETGLDTPGQPVRIELVTERSVRPPFEGAPPWDGGWSDE